MFHRAWITNMPESFLYSFFYSVYIILILKKPLVFHLKDYYSDYNWNESLDLPFWKFK